MIGIASMDISRYTVEIKNHAFKRALERGIYPDLIEETLLKGKKEIYGKHGIKFINEGAKRTLICVGQIIGTKITIYTIEEKN